MAKPKTNIPKKKTKRPAMNKAGQKQPITFATKRPVNNARTTASVENSLRKLNIAPAVPRQMDDWAACRLTPWNGIRGSLIPDGSNDPRIVYDHYCYTDIILTGAVNTFCIKTLPTLPWGALIVPAAPMVMNITGGFMQPSTTVPALGSGNLFAYSGTVGAPVPISAYRASIGTNWSDDPTTDDRKNFITANKARISSMGWRLTYTGPAASCSGVITVNSNSLITDPMMLKQIIALAILSQMAPLGPISILLSIRLRSSLQCLSTPKHTPLPPRIR